MTRSGTDASCVQGIGGALIWPTLIAIAYNAVPPERSALAIGVVLASEAAVGVEFVEGLHVAMWFCAAMAAVGILNARRIAVDAAPSAPGDVPQTG